MFTVQTQEVIPELNKIKELLEQHETQTVQKNANRRIELGIQKQEKKPTEVKDIEVGDRLHSPYKNGSETNGIYIDVTEDNIEDIKTGNVNPVTIANNDKTIEELRKEYTDKFGKKPFAGWNREVLISKIQ